jgi:hypothetical protein
MPKVEHLLFAVNLIQRDDNRCGVRTAVSSPERAQSLEDISPVPTRAVALVPAGSKYDNGQYDRCPEYDFVRDFQRNRSALNLPNENAQRCAANASKLQPRCNRRIRCSKS